MGQFCRVARLAQQGRILTNCCMSSLQQFAAIRVDLKPVHYQAFPLKLL